jgi:acetolactate synthase-1/2/3 large subunit
MSGARLFAQMMEGYGITHIFFVPAFMLKAFAEMEVLPFKRLMVHGEKAAAYMADGYARASGRPGLCMAQMIGASNLAAGIRDAYMAGAPLIAITGGSTPQSRYKHAYQEVDDITQFDAVTKFNAQVDTVTRLPDLLRQAFRVATSGAPGPVHLRIQSHLGQIIEQEADLDPLVETQYQRAPAFRPEPEMQRVLDALAVIAAAKRPVIVAGGGVVRSGARRRWSSLPRSCTYRWRHRSTPSPPFSTGIRLRSACRSLFARLREPCFMRRISFFHR